jgi:hypothetical protein
MSALHPEADMPDVRRHVGEVPKSDLFNAINCSLFDQLVGEREHIVGDFDAKRLGGLDVDYQLELG